MTPLRILHLRDTEEIGGPGKTILETFALMDKERFEMHLGVFLLERESEDTPFLVESRRRNINLHVIRSAHPQSPSLLTSLFRLVRRHRIDIIHTHEKKSDILGYVVARWAGIPVMSTLHGWILNNRKQRLLATVDRWVIRRHERTIAVSEGMKDKLVREGTPPEIIEVLHNCILTDRYRRNGKRGYLSGVLGHPLPGPVIGTVGRLSPEKGHKDFISAAEIVARKGYEGSFVIVGDGTEMDRLREMIASRNLESRIFLTGYLRDTVRILEDLDLMVLPSYTEGLPNVVLEALAMEVPVIATRVGGTPEVIEDGRNGILVPPASPESLAHAIGEFMENPGRLRGMVPCGRTLVETKFDFRERTRKLEAIYETIIRERAGAR